MDTDVLTNILNRMEDKLDKVSNGLIKNTSVTESHTNMLSDMKGVHDLNAKVILDTRDAIKDVKNELIKIDSWKNGQIVYQEQTLKDVKSIHERLSPIEKDFTDRLKKREDTSKNIRGIWWTGIERVVLWIAIATLISWRDLINKF